MNPLTSSRAPLYAPPRPRFQLPMPLSTLLIIAVGSMVLLGAAYHFGRVSGSADARTAARAEQLRVNKIAIAALTPRLQAAERAKITAAARVPIAEKHYQTARSRIAIADSSHVSIDSGPVLELPPPVITTIARSDTLVTELRLQVIAEHSWGEAQKERADLWQQRASLDEAQLGDQRSATRRTVAKAAAIGAAVGAILISVVRR